MRLSGTIRPLIIVVCAYGTARAEPICAGKGTIDEPRPLPKSLTSFANTLFGQGSARSTVYRCVDGRVYVCETGNGFSCDKPNIRKENPYVVSYCRDNPSDNIVPMSVTGHDTIYGWKCVRGHAVINFTEKLDDRGFRADQWVAAPGADTQTMEPPPNLGVNCESYPFGDDPQRASAFIKAATAIGEPQKILSGVCRSKFNQQDRDGLHNLGFNDLEIDSSPVADLSMGVVRHTWCFTHHKALDCMDRE